VSLNAETGGCSHLLPNKVCPVPDACCLLLAGHDPKTKDLPGWLPVSYLAYNQKKPARSLPMTCLKVFDLILMALF
jgi:hypothetical protein